MHEPSESVEPTPSLRPPTQRKITTIILTGVAWIVVGTFRTVRFALRKIDRFASKYVRPSIVSFFGLTLGPIMWLRKSVHLAGADVRATVKRAWLAKTLLPSIVTIGMWLIFSHTGVSGDSVYAQSLLTSIASNDQNNVPQVVAQGYSALTFNIITGKNQLDTESSPSTLSTTEVGYGNPTDLSEGIDSSVDDWLTEWQRLRGTNAYTPASPDLLPTVPEPQMARLDFTTYTVQEGDTATSIADTFGLRTLSITANNPGSSRLLKVGSELIIPPLDGLIETIKKGDSITGIAKKYSLSTTQLAAANPMLDLSQPVSVGTRIMLPDYGGSASVFSYEEPAPIRTTYPSSRKPIASAPTKRTNYAGPTPSTQLLWPLPIRRITQYYSYRHQAIDVGIPVGTPVWAADDGVVIKAGCGASGCGKAYGYYVIIDHGNGIQTLYAHNSRLYVHTGDRVKRGQQIAASGNTGRSTGPHLHFEVRSGSRKYNPLSYTR